MNVCSMNFRVRLAVVACLFGFVATHSGFAQKPPLTLDDFFNSVSFDAVRLAPDGRSVVIGVERADWEQNIFRRDLYLYSDAPPGEGRLRQLTQSGHDGDPQWSPDGRWIAFLSERKGSSGKSISEGKAKEEDAEGKAKENTQMYLISPDGGEAFPVTLGEEEVHAFAWAADSKSLYYSTRTPWTKGQKDAYKKDWKDVVEYRKAERGDEIFEIGIADALAARETKGTKPPPEENAEPDATPGARALARSDFRIAEIAASPNAKRVAFLTTSVSEREEVFAEFEIYAFELDGAAPERAPKRITNNEAQEDRIGWADDNRYVFFHVTVG